VRRGVPTKEVNSRALGLNLLFLSL
jgi:hypothetical protein